MSWLDANEYMVMNIAVRDRAEELLETSRLADASAACDEVSTPDGPPACGAQSRRATDPCWVACAAAAGS